MLSHNSVTNYHNLNFSLAQHHKYDTDTLENMIPFEYEIYVTLLIKYLEQEKERQRREQ
jgi:hypothetical protein